TTTRLSASPSSVNMTPESREVTNVSEKANQRMRDHSAAHGPAATNRNATYDSTETKAAANATAGRPATARGRHLSQPDAASPPSPMAASTTASMRLTVSVLATTNIDSKRNQT